MPESAVTLPSGSIRTVQPSCAEIGAPPMPYMKGEGLVSSMKQAKPRPRYTPSWRFSNWSARMRSTGTMASSLSSAAWCDSPSKRMPGGEV